MKYGEIWLVQYDPSTGHEFKKNRPAVIISSNKIIKTSNLITLMPITSNINNKIEGDFYVAKNFNNNLFADSLVKVQYISSFDKIRLLKRIGVLEIVDLQKIKDYLIKHFDI
ncbi:MAG: type II toxin-antitoxin system PemK/MazF family toxin [Candidatus Falkowbacteria bacterium]|nr:type II toxin-antitoxin system PemK/MazF family toxin [Candidatus Falkowbacteria bacterium]